MHVFTIELAKFRALINKDLNNPLHQWLLFLDDSTEQSIINKLINMNANIKTTNDRLQHVTQSADAYSMYVKRKIAQMDYNNGIRTAREEGEEQGVKKGEKRGVKKGVKIGVKQGVKQGVEKGKVEMIIRLHKLGLSVEMIALAAEKPLNDVLSIVKRCSKRDEAVTV
jgi:predicted transposase/invertase (TIGR01784 family)